MYRDVKLGRTSYYPSTEALLEDRNGEGGRPGTAPTTAPGTARGSIELRDVKEKESRVLVEKADFGLAEEYVAPEGLKK